MTHEMTVVQNANPWLEKQVNELRNEGNRVLSISLPRSRGQCRGQTMGPNYTKTTD